MPISVVIADDQEMVRTGFRMILESQPDIEVLDDVTDGAAALEAVERLQPDVLLLDIRMPELDGLEVTRRLAERAATHPEFHDRPRIVIVTTFDLDEYVHAALHGGACGFLLKDASPALLVEGVRAAAAGDALVSPAITLRLLRTMAPTAGRATARTPGEPLTEREEQVVRALATGRTNAEIADELFVSLSTVKTHLANVQAKLAARNRVEIAAWAWETGLASGG
ncbi:MULTISPECIES: response regulator [Streptomyces]|uniref:DNA-binding response regulator n=1 Tax=Streptomyces noursei TaxID=1971 RepID=A0A059W013_STRNR|nr:response regulator transcription factor [Streptomyces noursei]AKA03395.1 LuxR family transcriptional regulator [Streptomyces noursei ZPM]AIA02995.1 LuxR family two component transcriptional regulator [Streptomyces noursei]EOT00641.1 LuxR family transcriptional regulator [Streptomyces noursei CCRC 11814]EXU85234.1 LuxR family transcriptional regulator [Streptomyces noursei PD-1]MCE4944534.1 response regulator transcription factor [Streptomyces noursei]